MEPTRRCGPFSVWTSSWFYLSLLVNCHSQITTLATWSWQTQIHLWQPVAIAIPDNRTHRFKFLNVATGQNSGADRFRCVVAFDSLVPDYNDAPRQILAQPIKYFLLSHHHNKRFLTMFMIMLMLLSVLQCITARWHNTLWTTKRRTYRELSSPKDSDSASDLTSSDPWPNTLSDSACAFAGFSSFESDGSASPPFGVMPSSHVVVTPVSFGSAFAFCFAASDALTASSVIT